MRKFLKGTGLFLLAAIFATGCGNTSTATVAAAVNNVVNATTTRTYHMFDSAPGLKAVDPAAPATPIVVTANAVGTGTPIYAMTASVANQTFTDLHVSGGVYNDATTGKIYRVSAAKTGTPTPVQVSSEAAATNVCNFYVDSDFTSTVTGVVYQLPGADATCNTADDTGKFTLLSASNTTAPIALAGKMVDSLVDMSTGARAGYIALNGTNLQRCDANFANCATIAGAGVVNQADRMGNQFITVNNGIYHYAYSAGVVTLSASLFTIPGGSMVWGLNDGTDFFFFNSSTNALYKIPSNGSAAATTPLVTEAAAIGNLQATTTRLVYTVGNAIKSIARTGGAVTTLTANSSNLMGATHAGKVAYSVTSAGPAYATYLVNDDGTGLVTIANTMIAASVASSTGSFNADLETVKYVGVNMVTNAVNVIDANTGAVGTALGTKPATTGMMFGFGIGNDVMITGYDANSSDVFFVDINTAGSFTRVTNTATVNEGSIW